MKDEIKEILEYAKSKGYIDLDYEESKLLLDYITNLQEKYNEYKNLYFSEHKVKEDYKSRIDKAIEYIERCRDYHRDIHKEEKIFPDEITSLLMILQGEDKDE